MQRKRDLYSEKFSNPTTTAFFFFLTNVSPVFVHIHKALQAGAALQTKLSGI